MRKMNDGLAKDLAILATCGALFISAHMIVWEMDKANEKAVEERNRQREAAVMVVSEMVEPAKLVEVQEEEICPLTVTQFYPVPLDADLQAYIINESSAYGIDPAIIFAMIGRESDFRADAVGDGCKSFGLMQIQERWHKERMERLAVTDLLNPYQNVTVGIDYLAELLSLDRGLEWALMCYNGGFSYANDMKASGMVSDYAAEVMATSDTLKEGVTGYEFLLQ